MNKKHILLGTIVFVLIAICSALVGGLMDVPKVFAMTITKQEINAKTVTNNAGTFEGEGYYALGETANLNAIMNPGYQFDGWFKKGGDDREDILLSNEAAYSFNVTENTTIIAKWSYIDYSITLSDDLLEDFDLSVQNNTQPPADAPVGGVYYNDAVVVTVAGKTAETGKYIYDLNQEKILIKIDNNNDKQFNLNDGDQQFYLKEIIENKTLLDCVVETTNNDDDNVEGKRGFEKFVLTFKIQNHIQIDIDYSYMDKLTIQSGNDNPIEDLIKFVNLLNTEYKLSDNVVLVRRGQSVTLNLTDGKPVYLFQYGKFENDNASAEYSQSYALSKDSVYTVLYKKVDYAVSFNTYLKNANGYFEKLEVGLYEITSFTMQAGDTLDIEYNDESEVITIKEEEFNYAGVVGYNFIGFSVQNDYDNIYAGDFTFTMDNQNPCNIEIQILFQYVNYQLEIQLVDTYFERGVEYLIQLSTPTLNKGTQVTVSAQTSAYAVNGWSWKNTPSGEDYLSTEAVYTFTFEPIEDVTNYILYLDVDYKYYTSTLNLSSSSIIENVKYDTVLIDEVNYTITFKDSYAQLSDEVIKYTDEDKTTSEGTTTIETNNAELGQVKIINNVLSYGNHLVSSNIGVDESGVMKYSFTKYSYMADLQIAVVDYLTINVNGSDIEFNIYGTKYDENTTQVDCLLHNITTTMQYDLNLGAYKINYVYSDVYLYYNGENFDYILFRGMKFKYNGVDKFELEKATINTPNNVTLTSVKNSIYSLQLNNLIDNSLICYLSNTTSEFYGFRNYADQSGVTLSPFLIFSSSACILKGLNEKNVTAYYIRLQKDIHLLINDKNAYSEEDITFSINGVESKGLTISAPTDSNIVITIDSSLITKGYKFDGYRLQGSEEYLFTERVYSFVMQATFADATIEICFSPIEYILKVHYLDSEGEIITNYEEVNGALALNSSALDVNNADDKKILDLATYNNDKLIELKAYINVNYPLIATANTGYYVAEAYIGTQAYNIESLIGNNYSNNTKSYWILNLTNFNDAIISNASTDNEVQLYIKFAIHTYNVKVYFEVPYSSNAISYPSVLFNGIKYETVKISETEDVNGEWRQVDKYISTLPSINHGESLTIVVDDETMMIGVAFSQWLDANGIGLGTSLKINEITSNLTFIARLSYTTYNIKFVSLDINEQPCNYGSGEFETQSGIFETQYSFKMFEQVYFTVNPTDGYGLVETYYYDSANQKQFINMALGFAFMPSNCLIEETGNIDTVKIYLVFDLQRVQIVISNTKLESSSNLLGVDPSLWANYTLERERDGEITSLESEADYTFRTYDKLIMTINPISIGLELPKIIFRNEASYRVDITSNSLEPYKLKVVDIVEDGKIVGIKYVLEISFTSAIMDGLTNKNTVIAEEQVVLQNVFNSKKYALTYTHNLILEDPKGKGKYGIGLAVINNTTSDMSILGSDTAYTTQADFGTNFTFTCDSTTLEKLSEMYEVKGFVIAGEEYKTGGIPTYNLNMQIWETIALNRYINGNTTDLLVVLKLSPIVTLKNYDAGSQYAYTRTYTAQEQFLELGKDIIVADAFAGGVEILYNASKAKPLNVGTYVVSISVCISENTLLPFEEQVEYIIVPAKLYLSTNYSSTNPFTKTYNGLASVDINKFLDGVEQTVSIGLEIKGVLGTDKIVINRQNMYANFSSSLADLKNLHNISIYNISLLDNSTNAVPINYILTDGEVEITEITFERIGRINPRPITIKGFVAKDKVFDNSPTVQVDLSGIVYENIIATDSANIDTASLYFYCEDYSKGQNKEVKIDYSKALSGADSTNYTITYVTTYIDIYYDEITCEVEGYGTFKLVDKDRLCLIPFNSRLEVNAYDSDSYMYKQLYGQVETLMNPEEKFRVCYEFVLYAGVLNIPISSDLYFSIPTINKLSQVIKATEDNAQSLKFEQNDDNYITVKVGEGDGKICLINNTTYLPLWLIILIIFLILLLILIIIIIILHLRRKAKEKYSVNDRI